MRKGSRDRFITCYTLLGVASGFLLASLTFTASVPDPELVFKNGSCVITTKSTPYIVDHCITGATNGKGKFSQSDLGLPQDGFCEDRTNGVSWRVIKCLGTQPESQP